MSDVLKAKLSLIHAQVIDNCFSDKMKEIIKATTYFAGGCIRDLSRGKEPNDYDLFFYKKEDVDAFLQEVKTNYVFKQTAINNYNIIVDNKKVQVITLVSGNPETLTDTFDFTINTGFYLPQLQILQNGDISNNLIVCNNVFSPLNALVRLEKFLTAGYTMDQETLIQLGVAISKMNPIDNYDKLQEALKGISTSYIPKIVDNSDTNEIPF